MHTWRVTSLLSDEVFWYSSGKIRLKSLHSLNSKRLWSSEFCKIKECSSSLILEISWDSLDSKVRISGSFSRRSFRIFNFSASSEVLGRDYCRREFWIMFILADTESRCTEFSLFTTDGFTICLFFGRAKLIYFIINYYENG